jgi:hypothetical protein
MPYYKTGDYDMEVWSMGGASHDGRVANMRSPQRAHLVREGHAASSGGVEEQHWDARTDQRVVVAAPLQLEEGGRILQRHLLAPRTRWVCVCVCVCVCLCVCEASPSVARQN